MPPGYAPARSKNSSSRRSARSSLASCRSTTGTCRRPRAHCRCRGAISTRRSSGMDWRAVEREGEGSSEGQRSKRPRLGSRDARGGQAAGEVARRRADTRPRRADGTGLAASLGRRRCQSWRIAARRPRARARLVDHVATCGAGNRFGRRYARLAIHPRVRAQAGLLSYRRDHGHDRRRVERPDLLEAAAGHRPYAVHYPDHLGSRVSRSPAAAARLRQDPRSFLLSRTVKAMAPPPPPPPEFKNFIAGDWVAPATGEHFENRNPADWNDVIGRFPRSGPDDLKRAIASAKRGFAQWSKTPAPIRGQVLQRVGQRLVERKDDIARAMTREMGKVVAETKGDVQEGIDTAFYAATEGRRLFGRVVPSELRNKWAMSYRRPIGIAGLITPFNFPLAIPTWKMFPALLCGNAVILKPAEDVPHTATLLVELVLEAGLPPEAVQLVHGYGAEVGPPLVQHPEVPVISFTGSTATGAAIGETCGRMHKRLSLEMGGKNAMLVMADADLELALDGVVWGAFGTTGQRCTATSRLIVHEVVHDRLLQMVCDRAATLRLGSGLEEATEVGPLINEDGRKKVEYYVAVGREEGARVVVGGERATGKGLERGWFYQPTVLAGVRAGMRVAQEEIFGPVLSVIRVGSLDEAIRVNNGVQYGLSSSLYTRDVNAAFRAMSELDTGITYVNAPTIGAEAHLPFGGVKQTGNGHREGGWEVYDFYSETKVVYVDFSGKLQRAQIDTET